MKPNRLLLLAALLSPFGLAAELPSIDDPLRTGIKAPADAGVVIGIEDYVRKGVPDVPYAVRDAQAFNDFLISTRGVPTDRVQLLSENAPASKIRSLVTTLGKSVHEGGVAWVYFAGHGGASLNGGARMLLGDDVSQDPESFDDGGVLVSELEELAGAGGGRVVIVVDACYTGTGRDGEGFLTGKRTVVPGGYTAQKPKFNVVWSAASAGQTSGPLDVAQHGAFTYFALGALRGWADGGLDGERDGRVTMDEAQTYVQRALASAQITSQTPEIIGARDLVLSVRAGEEAPVISTGRTEAPRVVVPRTGEAMVVTDGKDLDFAALAAQVQASEQAAVEAREEAARVAGEEKRRAAEAARALAEKEAAAKALKDEMERRLTAERREKIDAAVAQTQAAATRDYAAISVLVASPSEAGRPVLEAWLARYGAAKVTIDGVTEGVVIAEVAKVRGALGKVATTTGPVARSVADYQSRTLGAMKWIPAGSFQMGSPSAEANRRDDETQHLVTLTKGYWMMEHEVTQGEWRAVMGTTPSNFTACGPECPAEQVSWEESVAFAKAASKRDGVTYRLPTEAEWERAARGGRTDERYAGGDELGTVAWAWANSGATSHAVCQRQRNGYGLCDMTGNVWEWVSDGYSAYTGAATDPIGGAAGSDRVIRGGSWSERICGRVATRIGYPADFKRFSIGVRLVRPSP